MRGNLLESGLLEIHRFLPPACLEGFNIDTIDIEGFLGYVARARYVQELEQAIVARAIADVFAE